MGKYCLNVARRHAPNTRILALLRALRFLARRVHIALHNYCIALHNHRTAQPSGGLHEIYYCRD
jgi:hypothetical protein